MSLDLRDCVVGDKLLTRGGEVLTYIEQVTHRVKCDPKVTYSHTIKVTTNYDEITMHRVRYYDGATGLRENNGQVRGSLVEHQSDIVKILTFQEPVNVGTMENKSPLFEGIMTYLSEKSDLKNEKTS